ncbi:sigma-54-dependent Fis family transcriptional regulator [Bacillaceae bacterium]
MFKFLVIAPYKGLKDLFLEVNKELQKVIDVEVGDLYQGVEKAKALENRGYDVIISRGATARLLREHCAIPVVDVKISGYDILRTLTLVKGYPGKIAIMSYLNTIHGADAIGKLLDMDNLEFYPIHEEKEIEQGIQAAVRDGVRVIIGDVISTTVATKYGLQGILITSGREAVLEAIHDAEQVAYYTRKEKEKTKRLTAACKHFPEGFVVVDENEYVQAANPQALSLLGAKEEEVSQGTLRLQSPYLNFRKVMNEGKKEIDHHVRVGTESYTIHQFPLYDGERLLGAAAVFQRTSVGGDAALRSRMNRQTGGEAHVAVIHFNHLVARSEKMTRLLETARKISQSDLPVIIYGEPGTGKNSLAQAIHNGSERRAYPYVFFNCEAFSPQQLEEEILGSEGEVTKRGVFELANGGTVFFDAIGTLPLDLQGKLFNIISQKKVTRINGKEEIPVDVRVIAANGEKLEKLVSRGEFREDLYHFINVFTLTVPPLRERIEDLDDLVRWFIASLNPRLGKQIVGVREEVMERLRKLTWPGNIVQLQHVVEQMCLMSDGPFIERSEVEPLLKKLTASDEPSALGVIDLKNKTLEEIEREIIEYVLKEEDYNQSRAAKRLGINRTTLWRKIKQGR